MPSLSLLEVSMYTIVKNGCPSGYAFVRDYLGNKMYYGTIKDCKEFIKNMERDYFNMVGEVLTLMMGESKK